MITEPLVVLTVLDEEVKQETDMLHWLNKAGSSLNSTFVVTWALADFCMPCVSAQDSCDDLAIWCGQPM